MASNAMPIIEQNYRIPVVTGSTTPINTLGTVSMQVLAAAQARKRVTFHNPNIVANVNVIVCQALAVDGTAIPASFSAPGGGFVLYPGTSMDVEGDAAQGAWNAVAQSGSNNALTIITSQG